MSPFDDAFKVFAQLIAESVRPVVCEEIATAMRERASVEADRPRPAAWWAEPLGCSAESLVKRARRGTLMFVKVGCRYYFTRAQIERSHRWQRRYSEKVE